VRRANREPPSAATPKGENGGLHLMNSQRAKAAEATAAETPPVPSKKRDRAPYATHIRGASPRCRTAHASTHNAAKAMSGGLQLQRSPVCTPKTSRRAKPAVAAAKAYL
jgi:hypothetical protein